MSKSFNLVDRLRFYFLLAIFHLHHPPPHSVSSVLPTDCYFPPSEKELEDSRERKRERESEKTEVSTVWWKERNTIKSGE